MLGAIPLWLHILGATVWVGSQVMMFVVVVPSIRQADDARSRYQVLQSVTARFGYLGFGALVLLIATGIDNLDRYSPAGMFDFRYGYILTVKLIMLAVVLILTVLHTFVVGPRLLVAQASEVNETGGIVVEQVRSLRMLSILISVLTLVLSLAIVFCAAFAAYVVRLRSRLNRSGSRERCPDRSPDGIRRRDIESRITIGRPPANWRNRITRQSAQHGIVNQGGARAGQRSWLCGRGAICARRKAGLGVGCRLALPGNRECHSQAIGWILHEGPDPPVSEGGDK